MTDIFSKKSSTESYLNGVCVGSIITFSITTIMFVILTFGHTTSADFVICDTNSYSKSEDVLIERYNESIVIIKINDGKIKTTIECNNWSNLTYNK